MRSMKLLAATAVLAAFVAGPVLAQDAGGTMTPSTTATDSAKTTTTKHHAKKTKHHAKKPAASTTAPATDSTAAPAK